jgi:hypothetical protein
MKRAFATSLLLVLALPLLAGCFNPFDPRELGAGISTPPPVPDSPANILRLLEWAYNNRSIAEYREIFTADYRFAFSTLDPAGDAYRGDIWTREDEVISATHLFQGGSASEPAALSISLSLGGNLSPQNDNRPGKLDRMHKKISTTVNLVIVTPDKQTNVTGPVTFYLVRGDVALIPEELSFGPDSTRWYIERWEDDTAGNGPGGSASVAPLSPARAMPTPLESVTASWGQVKASYR